MPVLTRAAPALSFDPARLPGDLFIGGAWRAGSTGSRIDVVDPSTGAAFRIERPDAGAARVCADFERPGPAPARTQGWPPFDPSTGCVTVSLTPTP